MNIHIERPQPHTFYKNHERLTAAARLWVQGKKIPEIADILGMSLGAMRYLVEENRSFFPKRNKPAPEFTEADVLQASEMWAAGKSAVEIRNQCFSGSCHILRTVRSDRPELFPVRETPSPNDALDALIAARTKRGARFRAMMKSTNCSIEEIAKEFGLSRSLINNHPAFQGRPMEKEGVGRMDYALAIAPREAARGVPVSLLDVRDSECRFMEGDSMLCCGKEAITITDKNGRKKRTAYCEAHYAEVVE